MGDSKDLTTEETMDIGTSNVEESGEIVPLITNRTWNEYLFPKKYRNKSNK